MRSNRRSPKAKKTHRVLQFESLSARLVLSTATGIEFPQPSGVEVAIQSPGETAYEAQHQQAITPLVSYAFEGSDAHFDGTRAVDLGYDPQYNLQDFTIRATAARSSAGREQVIASLNFQSNGAFGYSGALVSFGRDDSLTLRTFDGIAMPTISTGFKPALNESHDYLVTKQGTTVTFFVDGQEVHRAELPRDGFVAYNNTGHTVFGGRWSGTANAPIKHFEGTIESVVIYEGAHSIDALEAARNTANDAALASQVADHSADETIDEGTLELVALAQQPRGPKPTVLRAFDNSLFDGTRAVDLGYDAQYNLQDFTIRATADRSSAGQEQVIASLNFQSNGGFGYSGALVSFGRDDSLTLRTFDGIAMPTISTGFRPALNESHDYLVTKQGTTVTFFVDGQEVHRAELPRDGFVAYNDTGHTVFGGRWSGTANAPISHFEGTIESIAIYDGAYTIDEIEASHSAPQRAANTDQSKAKNDDVVVPFIDARSQNSPDLVVSGIFDEDSLFDGARAIDLGYDEKYSLQDFTIRATAARRIQGQEQVIASLNFQSNGVFGYSGALLSFGRDDSLTLRAFDGNKVPTIATGFRPELGREYEYVVSKEGKTVTFFVDGKQVHREDLPKSEVAYNDTGHTVIGGRWSGTAGSAIANFMGHILSVEIYDGAYPPETFERVADFEPSLHVIDINGPNIALHVRSPMSRSIVQLAGGGVLSTISREHPEGALSLAAQVTIKAGLPQGTYPVQLRYRPDGAVLAEVSVSWNPANQSLTLVDPNDRWTLEDHVAMLLPQGFSMESTGDLAEDIKREVQLEARYIVAEEQMAGLRSTLGIIRGTHIDNPELRRQMRSTLFSDSGLLLDSEELGRLFFAKNPQYGSKLEQYVDRRWQDSRAGGWSRGQIEDAILRDRADLLERADRGMHAYNGNMQEFVYPAALNVLAGVQRGERQQPLLESLENTIYRAFSNHQMAQLISITGFTPPSRTQILEAAKNAMFAAVDMIDHFRSEERIEAIKSARRVEALDDPEQNISVKRARQNAEIWAAHMKSLRAGQRTASEPETTRRLQRARRLVEAALTRQTDRRVQVMVGGPGETDHEPTGQQHTVPVVVALAEDALVHIGIEIEDALLDTPNDPGAGELIIARNLQEIARRLDESNEDAATVGDRVKELTNELQELWTLHADLQQAYNRVARAFDQIHANIDTREAAVDATLTLTNFYTNFAALASKGTVTNTDVVLSFVADPIVGVLDAGNFGLDADNVVPDVLSRGANVINLLTTALGTSPIGVAYGIGSGPVKDIIVDATRVQVNNLQLQALSRMSAQRDSLNRAIAERQMKLQQLTHEDHETLHHLPELDVSTVSPIADYQGHLGADYMADAGTAVLSPVSGRIVAVAPVNGYGTMAVVVELVLPSHRWLPTENGGQAWTDRIIMTIGHLRPSRELVAHPDQHYRFDHGQGELQYGTDSWISAGQRLGYVETHGYEGDSSDSHVHVTMMDAANAPTGLSYWRGRLGQDDPNRAFYVRPEAAWSLLQ